MYQKTQINAFGGLSSNVRPEMIDDAQASELVNLRFDKLGYLINRNGVQVSYFAVQGDNLESDWLYRFFPIGTYGIGEFVIDAPFGAQSGEPAEVPYDNATEFPGKTDRFMVYAVRLPAGTDSGPLTVTPAGGRTDGSNNADYNTAADMSAWNYKSAYVLTPLTGKRTNWRDELFFLPNGTTAVSPAPNEDYAQIPDHAGARSIYRPDHRLKTIQITAPRRVMGGHNVFVDDDDNPKDQNWIEHYVAMNQYRKAMVISDRVNGDLALVDQYSEYEYADTPKHYFRLRENCLGEFEIDDVVMDFGLGAEGFNGVGVEHGFTLYKYYLPRRRGVATRDNYQPFYVGRTEVSPTLEYPYLKLAEDPNVGNWNGPGVGSAGDGINFWYMPYEPTAFMTTEYFDDLHGNDEYVFAGIAIDGVRRYAFTMNETGSEIDDLFGALTFDNPDNNSSDELKAADVYVWEDMKIDYFPSSGLAQLSSFLSAKDRLFERSSSGSAKTIKLRTKTGVEQDVPLGVWRYRFVWDYGNGDYSAPSAELVAPDLLFSAMQDEDVTGAYGQYKRPFGVENEQDGIRSHIDVSDASLILLNEVDALAQGPVIFSGATTTAYGQNFLKIKEAVMEPDHWFAAQEASTAGASWPTDWSTEGYIARGQVGVIATVFFADDIATLAGTICEAAESDTEDLDDDISLYDDNFRSHRYTAEAFELSVPLFRTAELSEIGYNSVFTDYGIPRTIYQNSPRNATSPYYDADYPSYQIIGAGVSRFGYGTVMTQDDFPASEIATKKLNVYFNLVPFQTAAVAGVPQEENNRPDSTLDTVNTPNRDFVEYRNPTVVRAVRDEQDRVSVLKPNLPAEVYQRILLTGTGEFTLAQAGSDAGTYRPEFYEFILEQLPSPPRVVAEIELDHDDLRRYVPVNDLFYDADTDGDGIPNSIETYGVAARDRFLRVPTATVAGEEVIQFTNMTVVVSGRGERLTIPEQLSAYFPASLIFGAPRIKLIIPSDRVPTRARRLLIFRTLATHDNGWQPNMYGLVKTIDLIRDSDGELTGEHGANVEFLDDVKSDELDFSYDINEFSGFVKPIRSRFNLPLNERVYYANFVETYRPQTARGAVDVSMYGPDDEPPAGPDYGLDHHNFNFSSDGSRDSEMRRTWTTKLVDGDADTVNIAPTDRYLYYLLVYRDQARSYSQPVLYGPIDRDSAADMAKARAVLICAPSTYDGSVDVCDVYRISSVSELPSLRFTNGLFDGEKFSETGVAPDKYYYVQQGVVEYGGRYYYPRDIIHTSSRTDLGRPNDVIRDAFEHYPVPLDDRGSYGNPILIDITANLSANATVPIRRIGEIKPEDEGIFYDDDLAEIGRMTAGMVEPQEEVVESGIRWSEPYQPGKIRLESIQEVRSGDGDQITGIAQLAGNLLVFKERSIHRLAVQGADIPISRVDEISNTIGCIAPNTIININGEVYFLSWGGFYKYNNGSLAKVDGAFAEELLTRLRSIQDGAPNPAIRDASCGYNPSYREIYLNIPVFTTENDEGDIEAGGLHLADNIAERIIRGCVYAVGLETGMVTKYEYPDDYDPNVAPPTASTVPSQRMPRTYGKLYHTNTLGQLRSAEILPPRTVNYTLLAPDPHVESLQFLPSAFYVESPVKIDDFAVEIDSYYDEYLRYADANLSETGLVVTQLKNVPTLWRSKHFTAGDKSKLKRVRKAYAFFQNSDDPIVIRGVTHTSPEGPTQTSTISWQYTYTVNQGELSAVPAEADGDTTVPSQSRGERYYFELEAGGRVQIEYFGYYWTEINSYER